MTLILLFMTVCAFTIHNLICFCLAWITGNALLDSLESEAAWFLEASHNLRKRASLLRLMKYETSNAYQRSYRSGVTQLCVTSAWQN